MRYCQDCGTQLVDGARFCPNCGKPSVQEHGSTRQDLIDKLSSRLKTNGIIWAAIAIIQIIWGLSGLWNLLIVGVLNIICSVTNIKNSKRILINQNGIVQAYEPIASAIITLAYNLIVGGVIGVVGSIYYLIFVRGLIMENKSRFLAMETTNPLQSNCNVQNSNIIYSSVGLTEYEAKNGVEKEVYVADLQKTLKVCVPKNIKEGQTLALHNVKGINGNGEAVKKDVYIRINIKPTDSV